jgi:glutamate/tyrosine decarboxylase-like PLP-dependent enzyme
LHTDAAWGGAIILVPELRPLLDGIKLSDSITFDPHKWLAVPKGAGLFLTRHADVLNLAFQVRTAYMPISTTSGGDVVHPFSHSLQWTRRFIGLQVFLSLAVIGVDGYAAGIRHQIAMAAKLQDLLSGDGWNVVNDARLAVVCFSAPDLSAAALQQIAQHVVASGRAWISFTRIGDGIPVLRACIVNHKTQSQDLLILCDALKEARAKVSAAMPLTV